MRLAFAILGLTCTIALGPSAPSAPVRVWQDSIEIPTYAEGPANPNPPFDLFAYGRFNYPYPLRDALTERRETVRWRALHLENEYLRLTVLPDLGGHIYSCLDKRTGREMFYANTAIKKALIGYRGAWAAFGVEFNFPVSHNWMSISPVDFATTQGTDGSGSIWVGNVDRVFGSQWRVQLRLDPGRSVLEQRVTLYNASDARHRYYWWNNGAVQVWPDSRLVYPTEVMATHGFTRLEPWPVDASGRDLSLIRNQTSGAVSLFTYATREGFVGVYHPHTQSGTVHVADPLELPTHKVWSWGYDRDAADWRTALSDDDSAYVELQAGLFRNQETYAFLEPQETVSFSEHWLPVRDLGGITRANVDAVLDMERPTPTHVRVALDVTRDVPDAHVTVRGGGAAFDQRVSLSPREVWRWEGEAAAGSPVTIEVSDERGRRILTHTEQVFDLTPAASVHLGPQPVVRHSGPRGSVDDVIERGETDELEGRRLGAMERYRAAIGSHGDSTALLEAAGRLAVSLGWVDADDEHAAQTVRWLEAARARNTTDFEVQYYLGLALVAAGRANEAQRPLESAYRFRSTRIAAGLALGRVRAMQGDAEGALDIVSAIRRESPDATAAAIVEVALLRRTGRLDEARQRAEALHAIDPTNSIVRYELTLLGRADDALWSHLAADASRVLEVADQYVALGAYDDAVKVLDRRYPAVSPPLREPGAVSPNDSPLVAYYRGYARAKSGGDPAADYRTARGLPTTYISPNRRSSFAVLRAALQASPDDRVAQYLLGARYLASGLTRSAIEAWRRVRDGTPPIPTLHRSLGMALLLEGGDTEARAVLEQGTTADPRNVDVYLALDGVLSASNARARERTAALRRYPSADAMPAQLVFKLALALAEDGDAQSAERLFHDRFFPREEGGTSVRAVYAETRLISARVEASRRNCAAATRILDALQDEQAGLAFTRGGLADAIASPAMVEQAASIEAACNRQSSARSRWEKLARALSTDGAPLSLAIADRARARLGRARTSAERQRLERALDDASGTLESGSTSNPGLLEYARAALLQQLGRPAEAREARRRVFVFPDRNLSHALARIPTGAGAEGEPR